MLKTWLILILPAALLVQCGANHPPSGERVAGSSQQVGQNPNSENERCDFSDVKPMKARANHGAPMVSMPQPAYPPEAKGHGIQGKVVVLLLVNVHSGLVKQACVMEGDKALAPAAKEAALRVKFDPYNSYIQERYSYAEEIVIYQFVLQ